MLDPTSVRSEIVEAQKAREEFVRQRAALETTIAKLDAYIGAAEALLEHLPAAQGTLALGDADKEPTSLRHIVRSILQQNIGEILSEAMIYALAVNAGAEPRPTLEKGTEAVKYALYDLRKKEPALHHMGEGAWTYTPF